jgi:protein-S-isoprenylcysteine O-methyltransferase Ste14
LFWFLKDGGKPTPRSDVVLDSLLALQFVVPHSVLLLPGIKKRLLPYISAAFYGSFYCVVTCLSLLALIFYWQPCGPLYWQLHGTSKTIVQAAFAASWLALFYSLSLTGLGYQTGLTEWLAWLRGRPLPARAFQPRGAYLHFRHPVYLSFLGLIWFTPRMSLDHAVLTGIWTVYIFVGSILKDRRLAHYLGESYRKYAQQVAGYPFIRYGPLARWSTIDDIEPHRSQPHVPRANRVV